MVGCLAALSLCAATAAYAQSYVDWQQQMPSGPSSRIEDSLVYDSVANVSLMFGGYDLDWNRMNDLWSYQGSTHTWTLLTPPTGALPTRRSGQAMAYDPVRKVVVLFGGLDDNLGYLGDTWEWNTVSKTWTSFSPASAPSARQGARLIYDAANSRTLLIGGVDANSFYNQTWSWNGSTWTLLSVTTPAAFLPRAFPGATYNPTSGHGVTVFGGLGFPSGSTTVSDFNDLWELRNNVWTLVTPSSGSPAPRAWTQIVWDSGGNRLVMFGGYHVDGTAGSYGDTWEFSANAWSLIVPQSSGPGVRDSHGMVYDASRNVTVVFGGYFPDVIELSGSTWSTAYNVDWPPGEGQHAMAYDSDRDDVFMYGSGSGESWELKVATNVWSRYLVAGPGGRTGESVVYESARRKMLLFGGQLKSNGTAGNKVGDTWEWDTSARTWTNVSPPSGPQARNDQSMAYDPVHGVTVLFGGRDANNNPLNDTWLWNGSTWTNVTGTASGPTARYGQAMAYDAVRKVIVLFGGNNGSQNLNDVWEWNGTAEQWAQIMPSSSPPIRMYATMAPIDALAPGVAIFGGVGAAALNDTWAWNGSTWAQATLGESAPSARQHAVMVYDSAAQRDVLYGGIDARGISTELWTASINASGLWPAPVSVSPSQGQGPSATFTALYRDANGVGQIREVLFLVNSSLSGVASAYVLYSPSSNTLLLRNDGDNGWTSGTVGSAAMLSNSQVTINLASVSATLSTTDLTLTVPMAFLGTFNGGKTIYMAADDLTGASPAGWQAKGSFLVSTGNSPPEMISLAPAVGAGLSDTFTTVYREPNGVNDLQQVYFMVSSSPSGVGAALFYYVPASNTLYLSNDAGTGWGSGATPGAAVTLSNSQVSVNVAGVSVTKGVTDLTLVLPLRFTPAFAGAKNVYLFAVNFEGAHPPQFQQLGTFTVSTTRASADITVFRPSTGTWYSLTGASGWTSNTSIGWGLPGDVPIHADFDGDGLPDLAVFRPSNLTWYILTSSSNFTSWMSLAWGLPGDIPLAADFDGDGKADLVMYRPSTGTWYVLLSSTNYQTWTSYQWGLPGDIPIVADLDGDGKADLVVYRPTEGRWYVRFSSSGYSYSTWTNYGWGLPGDIPVAADFDGDGKTDLAVWRPSTGTWYILFSSTNYQTWTSYGWGLPTDIPVVGDFDGDGKADLAVWRPTTGTWYFLYSSTGYSLSSWASYGWGLPNDIPINPGKVK